MTTVFSFPNAVDLYVKKNPIIHILCSELLMFYYALCSWKKNRKEGITLYRNSSYITPDPHLLLVMKRPITATLFMGMKKQYKKVAISSDSPLELKQVIVNGMAQNKNSNEEDV